MAIELSVWVTPAVVIAVGALLLRSMSRLEDRLGARLDETNKSLGARLDATNKGVQSIDSRLRTVEQGQARLQGLVEGLRAMVSGRRSAA